MDTYVCSFLSFFILKFGLLIFCVSLYCVAVYLSTYANIKYSIVFYERSLWDVSKTPFNFTYQSQRWRQTQRRAGEQSTAWELPTLLVCSSKSCQQISAILGLSDAPEMHLEVMKIWERWDNTFSRYLWSTWEGQNPSPSIARVKQHGSSQRVFA